MNAISIHSVLRSLDPSWLMGPIFGKELRVSSRRQRNYLLRFAYLVVLMVFLVVIWLNVVDFSNAPGTYVTSRLAQAGKQIIVTLVWFQFYATQLVAVVMLSTAISDEIYHRTLGVLMTTPITSFQIVMGKLSSKLFQLILLLGVSLPVLAVVRVFGGVPWNYIISSLCMTLTSLIFVASVTLCFSTFSRKAYVVIILTLAAIGIFFGFPLLLMSHIPFHTLLRSTLLIIPCHANPHVMLNTNTIFMLHPNLTRGAHFFWSFHCVIMLTASTFILLYCMRRVRRIALAQVSSRPNVLARLERFWMMKFAPKTTTTPTNASIRRVKGPPVAWKELKSRISSREKLIVAVIIGLELAMIVAMYLFPFIAEAYGHEETHQLYLWIFMGMGALSATVLPSTCITSEKESHSWPLLLTTTLNDWQIVFGKFVGVLRRSMFIWLLLFVYVGLFWIYQCVGPLAFIHLVFLITGIVVFLCGTGFYFSSRLKHTSEAVITNIALAASVWGFLPLLLALLEQAVRSIFHRNFIFRGIHDLRACYLSLIPFVQAKITIVSSFSQFGWSKYRWPDQYRDSMESTYFMLVVMLAYMVVGMLFSWRATLRFRQNIF